MTGGQRRLRAQLVAAVVSDEPRVPEAGRLAWGWFRDLHARRTYGMVGPDAIQRSEVEAYARTARLPLEPHHVDLVLAMDDAWLSHARKKHQKSNVPDGMETLPPISEQEMNADLFDAMFEL